MVVASEEAVDTAFEYAVPAIVAAYDIAFEYAVPAFVVASEAASDTAAATLFAAAAKTILVLETESTSCKPLLIRLIELKATMSTFTFKAGATANVIEMPSVAVKLR